ncbi:hypothetical protein MnTg03_01084 [bacterium MnTg03]|nr:hypothetical protein MnTg03_01084 [bacterium MnTg03]
MWQCEQIGCDNTDRVALAGAHLDLDQREDLAKSRATQLDIFRLRNSLFRLATNPVCSLRTQQRIGLLVARLGVAVNYLHCGPEPDTGH